MNKFEILVANAQYAVYLLLLPQTGDFALVELGPGATLPENAVERGAVFGGVLAIVDGEPRKALNIELNDAGIAALADAFARHVAARFQAAITSMSEAPPVPVSAEWCEALHRLEDTRDHA